MKILIIPDKFKFTFSSLQIGQIISNIIKKYSTHETEIIPISDGGEGFIDAISLPQSIHKISTITKNPVFENIESFFVTKDDTAYIEYAKTGGLYLLNKNQQNPMFTTSYGLGQQIKKAKELGIKKVIIGLGGSATNDGGIGMANALGIIFLDKNNNHLKPIGQNLINIEIIIKKYDINDFTNIEFFAATDVLNPLLGDNGATNIYAKQKGASSKEIKLLETGMKNYVQKMLSNFGIKLNSEPGEGAAGGLAAGIKAFLNGKIISGSELLSIEEKIKESDIIITGEGKLDKQSFQGKIVGKICELSKKHNKHTIIICGISEISNRIKGVDIIKLFDENVEINLAIKKSQKILENKLIKNILTLK